MGLFRTSKDGDKQKLADINKENELKKQEPKKAEEPPPKREDRAKVTESEPEREQLHPQAMNEQQCSEIAKALLYVIPLALYIPWAFRMFRGAPCCPEIPKPPPPQRISSRNGVKSCQNMYKTEPLKDEHYRECEEYDLEENVQEQRRERYPREDKCKEFYDDPPCRGRQKTPSRRYRERDSD